MTEIKLTPGLFIKARWFFVGKKDVKVKDPCGVHEVEDLAAVLGWYVVEVVVKLDGKFVVVLVVESWYFGIEKRNETF